MMKNLFVVTVFVLISAVGAAAQSEISFEQTQKTLKKNLLKHAPIVFGVKFKDCRLSIKTSFSLSSNIFSKGSPFVGSSYTGDDASGSLSAGPGSEIGGSIPSTKHKFDLSDLKADRISVVAARRKDTSLIILATRDGKKTIEIWRGGKQIENDSTFSFAVKTKAVDKIADAFRQVIRQCGE